MAKIIRVVVGVLFKNNKVLIASRPHNKSYCGYWEFPGGKIELRESLYETLTRELEEEIGIITKSNYFKYIMFIKQPYENYEVELNVMMVTDWLNTPVAVEKQELFWQPVNQPCRKYPLLSTTQKILDYFKDYNL